MENIYNCILCGSNNLKEFYKGIDKYYSKKIIKCDFCLGCGLVFLNPMPREDEYDEWYKFVFQDKRRGLKIKEDAVSRLIENNSYKNKLIEASRLSSFISKERNKCLEIGCGWGTLAYALQKEYGAEVDVVEPSHLACEVARDYYKLSVFERDFNQFFAESKGKKYDLIFMYHVFEHLHNPCDFLEKVSKLLNTGGILFLALPDATNPDEPSDRFFHFEHCFYYSTKTLSLILEKYKFKPVKITKDYKDMKIACVIDNEIREPVYKNDEINKIRKSLRSIDRKYAVLRSIKKSALLIFGGATIGNMSCVVSKFLRKIKIIKV